MADPSDLVGYTFRADTYCGADIGTRLAQEGWSVCPAEVARVDGEPECAQLAEIMLDELASQAPLPLPISPIDRKDESSFNSDDFPKVVLRDQANGARCVTCGQFLGNLPKIPTSVRISS